MSDTETDLAVIAGRIDENGDKIPQRRPIENPGDPDAAQRDDPVAEPHPAEPGAPSDA